MWNSVLPCTCQSVVVKGLERNISCLYEARRLLLGLDSCETAKVIEVTPEPVLAGSRLTNYWLNMLLQQLRVSEQGEDLHTHTCRHTRTHIRYLCGCISIQMYWQVEKYYRSKILVKDDIVADSTLLLYHATHSRWG